MQWIGKALDDFPGLLGRHEDGLVIGSGAGLDRQHRVVLHELVQGTDAIDPKHVPRNFDTVVHAKLLSV